MLAFFSNLYQNKRAMTAARNSAQDAPVDALVIGGGFYGAAIAVYLARQRGLKRVLWSSGKPHYLPALPIAIRRAFITAIIIRAVDHRVPEPGEFSEICSALAAGDSTGLHRALRDCAP